MPEEMRNRMEKITVYAFVRDPSLPRYLDYADLALARKKGNLKTLSKGLHDSDPVIRYWSVVGLLLEKRAQPALPGLKKALNDSDEIPSLAAWAIFKAGEKDFAKQWMLREITENPGNKMLASVLDWMDRDSFSILGTRKTASGLLGRRQTLPGSYFEIRWNKDEGIWIDGSVHSSPPEPLPPKANQSVASNLTVAFDHPVTRHFHQVGVSIHRLPHRPISFAPQGMGQFTISGNPAFGNLGKRDDISDVFFTNNSAYHKNHALEQHRTILIDLGRFSFWNPTIL